MVKAIGVSNLRRLLGIKKLKKIIPMSKFEKAIIRDLRQRDKQRVTRIEKLAL